jgi:predicted RNA methylase
MLTMNYGMIKYNVLEFIIVWNKIVADFGAGGGSFLDAIQEFAKKTIAIEPTRHWHKEIKKNILYFHMEMSYQKPKLRSI